MRIRYFAWMKRTVGTADEEVTLPDSVTTVGELVEWLRGRSPGHAAAFEHAALIRCAVNQTLADAQAAVAPGDEVAFFPPVTGG